MKTEMAKDIERAQARIQYDAHCKKVLSNKHILAWIMQTVIKEYSHLSIDFIRRCIEGNPEISTESVEPGYTSEKISGLNTEDKDAKEGMITYDIRYAAYMPRDAKMVKILVNLEGQKDLDPGYEIESRGDYYGARMITSQNGVEFAAPDYGDIKKVYSIWVCMNAPKSIGDAISVYELKKTDIIPGIPDRPEAYDKMSIILICLSGKPSGKRGFIDMMNTLFSTTMDVETKKRILKNEYQIPMETGFVEELSLMCNISEWVFETGLEEGWRKGVEQGMREGMEQGMREGMEQGLIRGRKEIVKNLLEQKILTDDQILRVVHISEDELLEIKKAKLNGM